QGQQHHETSRQGHRFGPESLQFAHAVLSYGDARGQHPRPQDRNPAMIKLGVLDFDTSHVVEFTKRLNHVGIKEDQWVEGAQVVMGCPGESKIMPERIPEYTKQMKEFGVPLVDRPEEMIGKVDGMLIESKECTPPYDRPKPSPKAGIPSYIDKPFPCPVDPARKTIAWPRRRSCRCSAPRRCATPRSWSRS